MTDDVIALTRQVVADSDPTGTLPTCGIRQVLIGPDEWLQVRTCLAGLLRGAIRPTVALVMDTTPILRDGRDLKADLAADLRRDCEVREVRLSDGHAELHAAEPIIATATQQIAGVDAVVTVGGGTVTDIGKMATRDAAALPLVVVMTAASVDGFTDDVSVILRSGVKRTVPSRWPDVVIADVTTIGGAPARMNLAGYGELNSMFTAPADWRLADLVGLDTSYHPGPIRLLERVADGIDEWSAGLGRAAGPEPESTLRLTRALALRGIATGISGSTACLSGVEHLFSHMLDMANGAAHRPIGLHGTQVGVGSVLAAATWEMLFDRLRAEPDAAGRIAAQVGTADAAVVQGAFAALDPAGRIGAECWADYGRKAAALQEHRDRLVAVLGGWPEHEGELRGLMRTADQIAAGLTAAGAPALVTDLDSVPDPATGRWALERSPYMRGRLTVLDVLVALGWWDTQDVTEVFERAQRAVDGAKQAQQPQGDGTTGGRS